MWVQGDRCRKTPARGRDEAGLMPDFGRRFEMRRTSRHTLRETPMTALPCKFSGRRLPRRRAVIISLRRVPGVTVWNGGLSGRKNCGPGNLSLVRKLMLIQARVTPTARNQSMRGELKRRCRDSGFLLKPVNSASSLANKAKPRKSSCGRLGWTVPRF